MKADTTATYWPSTLRSTSDLREKVIFPWDTGSVMLPVKRGSQELHGPRPAPFWRLIPSLEHDLLTSPIRHTTSISVEEERVRDILNVCELNVVVDYAHVSNQSIIDTLHSWIRRPAPVGTVTIGQTSYDDARMSEDAPLHAEWVQEVLADGSQSSSTAVLINLINGLEDALAQKRFNYLDDLLSSMNYSMISPEALVAFVRTTYQARARLRSWKFALNEIERELIRRGIDAHKILIGLVS